MPFWGSYVQGRVARADVCVGVVCECVCDCEYVWACVIVSTLTLLPALWGAPPPPRTFFSRMTSLAGRPAASDEQVRRVPRCDAR